MRKKSFSSLRVGILPGTFAMVWIILENSCKEDMNSLKSKWLEGFPERPVACGGGNDGGGGIPG